jgi:tRNA(Arg) A34 adenosine deaminase TadA
MKVVWISAMLTLMNDQDYLQQAIKLANQSKEPIGCGSLLVDASGQVIASAYNTQREDGLVASHAEMKSIAIANKVMGRKLSGITVYGNCEPCTMCLTALIFAGVDRIVFAQRLNDLVSENQQISVDCFEFVKNFPYQPKLVHQQI